MQIFFQKYFYQSFIIAFLFLGVGYISITPPFEGFDEVAHLSSIWEMESNSIPRYGVSSIDRHLANYPGPVPFKSGKPPFDSGGVGYKNFFDDQQRVDDFKKYVNSNFHKTFNPVGIHEGKNWEAQHPFLYYLLLSRVSPVFKQFGVLGYIFSLRLLSFMLVISGLILICMMINNLTNEKDRALAKLGLALYPLVIPEVFFDLARIGNDSLCFLFTCSTAYFLQKTESNLNSSMISAILGIILGLGLMTKALFLPISFAVLIFYFLNDLNIRNYKQKILNVFIAGIFLFCIAGWWYLRNYLNYGSLTGSDELIGLDRKGGFIENFLNNANLYEILRGLAVPLVSYVWAGSQSLVRMPYLLLMPLLIINAIIFFFAARQALFSRNLFSYQYFYFWVFLLFYLALCIHMLNAIALYGRATTPGWYMNILLPWAISVTGIGWKYLLDFIGGMKIVIIGISYLFFFQIVSIYFLITMYSGCSIKGPYKTFEFTSKYYCLNSISNIYENISLISIGFPFLPIALFAIGFGLLAILLKIQFMRIKCL